MKKEFLKEEKIKFIEHFKNSELSKTAYCEAFKISPRVFTRWLESEELSSAANETTFLKLNASKVNISNNIVISIDDINISVDSTTDLTLLKSVLKVVKSL